MSVFKSRGGGGGVGDLVPHLMPIYPNPVITPEMAAEMRARTILTGLNGLGCGCNGLGCADCGGECMRGLNGLGIPGTMLWPELAMEQQQGRDVEYTVMGLAGVGDFAPANVASQPGITGPFSGGATNGLLNALKQARGGGVGAVDTTSLAAFANSVESGSSTLFGVTLPNWGWAGLAAVGIALVTGAHKKGR